MGDLYYTPPSDKVWNEVTESAIKLWEDNYDNTFGYVTEKVERIKNTPREHFMSIIRMFDSQNQVKLADMLSEESKKEIRIREGEPYYLPF
jgi:hypothetical protein